MEVKKIVSGIVTSLDKHKAQDIRVIEVTDVTSIAVTLSSRPEPVLPR